MVWNYITISQKNGHRNINEAKLENQAQTSRLDLDKFFLVHVLHTYMFLT